MAAPAPTTVVLDVSAIAPDGMTIDALARLHLTAGQRGQSLTLRFASDELRELIAFVGLEDVLRIEPRRQAEQREQGLRVEEERQLDDPTT
jgi:anti-anti-sigma regulatory factor